MPDWIQQVISFMIGVFVGVFIQALYDILKTTYTKLIIAWGRRKVWRSPDPNLSNDVLEDQGFVFGWLNTPDYIPVYGNGLVSYQTIRCMHNIQQKFEPPNELIELFEVTQNRLKTLFETDNRPFTPGPVARVLTVAPPIDEGDDLVIMTHQANFHQHRVSWELLLQDSSNKLVDRSDNPLNLRSKYDIRPRLFDNPVVCSCLGVNITVITSDNKVVIVKRSQIGTYLRDLFLATIGEGVHPALDKSSKLPQRDGTIFLDPFQTAVRGAREELGIDIAPARIRFFALGVHKTTMDPDLLGVARIRHTQNDLVYSMISARPRDRWEITDMQFIDFNPKTIAQFIKAVGIGRLAPATPLCLIFSLLRYFPEKEVRKAFLS